MNGDRIVVQELHGHWSAWWEHTPQIAFGGADPAEAVDGLVGIRLSARRLTRWSGFV